MKLERRLFTIRHEPRGLILSVYRDRPDRVWRSDNIIGFEALTKSRAGARSLLAFHIRKLRAGILRTLREEGRLEAVKGRG